MIFIVDGTVKIVSFVMRWQKPLGTYSVPLDNHERTFGVPGISCWCERQQLYIALERCLITSVAKRPVET